MSLKAVKINVILLLIAFFISGASALIYQVLWVKELTLIFGSQTLAISTILSAFMGGLALGSYLMGKKGYLIKKVIWAYVILEVLIGIYALLIPHLFDCTTYIYKFFYSFDSLQFLPLLRFILSLLVLIIPTSLMGATLPLLIKYFVNKDDFIVKYTGLLYGINTLGAVIGAFVCGFYLIELLGVTGTNYLAVSLNLLAAIIAVLINIKVLKPSEIEVVDHEKLVFKLLNASLQQKLILFAMLLSGFTAMAYEVLWARQLVLIFGSTTYAYTSMLVIFLAGISLGSLSIDKLCKDKKNNITYFIVFEFLIAVLVIAGSFYYKELFFFFNQFALIISPEFFFITILTVSFLLIFPPTFIFGLLFPISIDIFNNNYKVITGSTGLIYSYNTIGCILGAFMTGFVLIPSFGIQESLIYSATINIAIAFILLQLLVSKSFIKIVGFILASIVVVFAVLFPANWDKQIIASGSYVNKSGNKASSKKEFINKLSNREIVYYEEGSHSTIAVIRQKNKANKSFYSLYNNGKIEASTYFNDMRTQVMLGYLPLILKDNPEDVMIIGMGSGITTSVVLQFAVKELVLVELEEAIKHARIFFIHPYGDAFKDERLKFVNDDARNYLKVVDKKFDIIISEPSNIWVNGVANLFTRDFYKELKDNLKDEGVLCQWIQLYDLEKEDIYSVIKALKSEFKYINICHTKTSEDFLFLASNKPIEIKLDIIEKNMNHTQIINKDLKGNFNIFDKYSFLNLMLADSPSIDKFLKIELDEVPVNSDDNSFLEYKAARKFYKIQDDYTQEVFPLTIFKKLKGLSYDQVTNADKELYKTLATVIKKQYDRSKKALFNRENYELPLYRLQGLVYSRKYFNLNPLGAEENALLGLSYLRDKKPKEGVIYLEKAVELGSTDSVVYKTLARYYNRLIFAKQSSLDPLKALEYSKKAKELEPDNSFVDFLLGVSYLQNNKYKESLEYLSKYRKAQTNKNKLPNKFFKYYSKAYLNASN